MLSFKDASFSREAHEAWANGKHQTQTCTSQAVEAEATSSITGKKKTLRRWTVKKKDFHSRQKRPSRQKKKPSLNTGTVNKKDLGTQPSKNKTSTDEQKDLAVEKKTSFDTGTGNKKDLGTQPSKKKTTTDEQKDLAVKKKDLVLTRPPVTKKT